MGNDLWGRCFVRNRAWCECFGIQLVHIVPIVTNFSVIRAVACAFVLVPILYYHCLILFVATNLFGITLCNKWFGSNNYPN